jgi:uncharacterized SAM-binding protein YcdF (DUF218 family)
VCNGDKMSDTKPKPQRKSLRRLIALSICFFVVWAIIAPFFAAFLVVEKPVEKSDAIWVLGGSSVYLERTQKAAELYKKGAASKIFVVNDGIFGGWDKIEQKNLPFYELSKRELIAGGVNESAIEIVEPIGDGTNYEARMFAEKNTDKHLKSLLLVTSPYHTQRALWAFRHFNPEIEISVMPAEKTEKTPTIYFWWLSPKGWSDIFGEYLKFTYYWLFL